MRKSVCIGQRTPKSLPECFVRVQHRLLITKMANTACFVVVSKIRSDFLRQVYLKYFCIIMLRVKACMKDKLKDIIFMFASISCENVSTRKNFQTPRHIITSP